MRINATLLSSFFLFLISAFFVLPIFGGAGGWMSDLARIPVAQYMIWSGFLSNGIFFFFFGALLEEHTELRDAVSKLSGCRRGIEYFLRFINHTMILVMWTMFTKEDPYFFPTFLSLLYFSFLLWDGVCYRALRQAKLRRLALFDSAGLLLALAMFVELSLDPHPLVSDANHWMALAYTNACYTFLAAVGVGVGIYSGYRPWAPKK